MTARRRLCRWLGWFAVVDAAVLAALPLLVLVTPMIALVPRPRVVIPLAVLLASAGLSFLVLDSLVFTENRYHVGMLTFTLLTAP